MALQNHEASPVLRRSHACKFSSVQRTSVTVLTSHQVRMVPLIMAPMVHPSLPSLLPRLYLPTSSAQKPTKVPSMLVYELLIDRASPAASGLRSRSNSRASPASCGNYLRGAPPDLLLSMVTARAATRCYNQETATAKPITVVALLKAKRAIRGICSTPWPCLRLSLIRLPPLLNLSRHRMSRLTLLVVQREHSSTRTRRAGLLILLCAMCAPSFSMFSSMLYGNLSLRWHLFLLASSEWHHSINMQARRTGSKERQVHSESNISHPWIAGRKVCSNSAMGSGLPGIRSKGRGDLCTLESSSIMQSIHPSFRFQCVQVNLCLVLPRLRSIRVS